MSAMQQAQVVSGPRGFLTLVGLAGTGTLGAMALAALTNAFNGWLSPTYFAAVMGWDETPMIGPASIAQGVFEALVAGGLLSVLFAAVVGTVSRASCSYRAALPYLADALAVAVACWALGGALAVTLASFSPEFYRTAFVGVPDGHAAMLRFAWVGGSIWGIYFGGFAGVVLASVVFRARWHERFLQQAPRVAAG